LDTDLEKVLGHGARISQYVPENAYAVWTPDEPVARELEARAAGEPLVQLLEDFEPEDALSPALDAALGQQLNTEVHIQLFNHDPETASDIEAIKRVATRITAAPHTAVRDRYVNLRVIVPGRDLAAIAALATVINVEPYQPPQLHGEREGQILAGNLDLLKMLPLGPGYLGWL